MRRKERLPEAVLLLAALLLAAAAPAQIPGLPSLPGTAGAETAQEAPPEVLVETLQTQATEAEQRLAEALSLAENPEALPPGISAELAEGRVQAARNVHKALQARLQQVRDLETERAAAAAARESLESFVKLEEPPPYTMAFLDTLRGQVDAKQSEIDAERLGRDVVRGMAERETANLERLKMLANQAAEAAKAAASEEDKARTLFALDTARRSQRAAETGVEALRAAVAVADQRLARLDTELELGRRRAAAAAAQTLFTQKELEEIEQAAKQARTALEEELAGAQRELDRRTVRDGELARRAGQEGPADPALAAQRETSRVRVEAAQGLVNSLGSMLEMEADTLEVWRLRFEVAHPGAGGERRPVTELEREMDAHRSRYDGIQAIFEQRLNAVRAQTLSLDKEVQALPEEARAELRVRREALAEREAGLLRLAARGEALSRLIRAGRQDIRGRLEALSGLDRAAQGVSDLWRDTLNFFDRELFTIGDESITPRKLIIAVVILVFGLLFTRLFLNRITGFAITRLKLRPGGRYVVETITRYLLLLIVFYAVLKYLNISLTVFTFIGGAAAIGVGFGAQTLVSNFLSSLILMGEQPIRVGDIVEVGGLTGYVMHMGARACTVRTFSGVEVLVPNSKFLEDNVVNWTLSDQKMRFDVTVGVAFGSDIRRVKDILEDIAGRHGQILKDPEPVVVFQDFGDNSLVFAVYFWLDLEKSDSRVVRSDIRFMIERAFAKENIAIAFPQRDVHMNMAGPVEVRLAPGEGPGGTKE